MKKKWEIDVSIVEQGDIYFFYKPRRKVEATKGLDDVARFFLVMDPESDNLPRYIVMGVKKLPRIDGETGNAWGFVQIVGGRGFKTLRNQVRRKGMSRPAGEGIYAMVEHRDHMHLMYALELPEQLGKVQRAFNIEKEGNYIFLSRLAEVAPKSAETPFSNFSKAEPEHLNRRGTEVLLVGVGADVGRLGIKANKDNETISSADLFSRLEVSAKRHPLDSIISGEWV